MNIIYEQLTLFFTQFHWLRPLWLLTLIPAVVLIYFLWQHKRNTYQWQQLISPELLPYLVDGKSISTKKSWLWVLLFAWICSSIAMAGPSWIKRSLPVVKNQDALVILLDLSYSMISEDIKPSRIARARLKIADILRDRKDGQTALVAYAGEAHTVTPMSDDSSTIVSLLSSMHPNIMPTQGSNTEAAVERGIQLLNDAGLTQGTLLLITDGVVPEAFDKIKSLLARTPVRFNILGVGTTQPAPIPSPNGGFLRNDSGTIITTQLNGDELTQLVQDINGRYHEITNSDSDINYLTLNETTFAKQDSARLKDVDQWLDHGHWLVFLLLPIALLSFRRGLLPLLLVLPMLAFTPSSSYALGMDDMWLTKDQQAQRELKNGDAKQAAEKFESTEWKATALYRAGDYARAADTFAQLDTAQAHYNRGNALAKAGKLEEAIKAYDEALKRNSNFSDAKKNRVLVEKLLKEQQEKQEQQKDNEDKNQANKNDQQNPDQKQGQQGEPKEQDQKDQDQKNQGQNNSDNQSEKSQQNGSQSSATENSSVTNRSSATDQSSATNQTTSSGNGQSQAASSAESQAQKAAQASSAISSKGQDLQSAAQIDQQMNNEQKQAMEQWLRRVPDDPGGLLRNKFKYQYELNRQKEQHGELKSPANNADQRL